MIHVAQLTDTHLFAEADRELYGVNTRDSLQAVIANIQLNLPKLDLLLVTGDLVHDETKQGYLVLRELVEAMGVPACYLPGNHDDPEIMQSVFSCVPRNGITTSDQDSWTVVLLDSSIRGRVEGEIKPETLSRFADCLTENKHKHVLIALHHHVIDVQSAWIDSLNLRNNGELLRLLSDFPNVKLVLNGHIHQELDVQRDSIRFLGSPATCFQFRANQEKAQIDNTLVGFRHIVLNDNGSIDTEVHYMESSLTSLPIPLKR